MTEITPLQRFDDLLKDIKRALSDWGEGLRDYTVEDAISDAILYLMKHLETPQKGYRFRGALPAYLTIVARHNMLAAQRRERHEIPIGENSHEYVVAPSMDIESGGHYGGQEIQELLTDWQDRYRLAESFFRETATVKQIWSVDLQRTLLAHLVKNPIRDEELAKHTGETLGAIYTTRRRLHGRLSAIGYLMNMVLAGFPDEDHDVSLLAWLYEKKAIDEREAPTIRTIAALVRAAQHDNQGLLWALFSRWLTWYNGIADFNNAVNTLLPLLKNWQSPEADIRLQRAAEWFSIPGMRKKITDLRRESGGFFVPACWYLAVLQQVTADNAVAILKVHTGTQDTSDEEAQVRKFMQELS